MRRTIPAVLALLLAVSVLAVVPAAMAQQTETDETSDNESIAPGAQLSGAVGVQEAELSGDVESRSYGIRIAQANSSDAKAGVVADQLNATEQRISELESERAELDEARANGSMSTGEYSARTATLHAQSQTVRTLVNQSNETASGLPTETLEANGINATAIRTLSTNAANLTGPETAAIARTIAGPNVGDGPGNSGNATDAGDRRGGDRNTTDGEAPTEGVDSPTPESGDDTRTTTPESGDSQTPESGDDTQATDESTGGDSTDGSSSSDSAGSARP